MTDDTTTTVLVVEDEPALADIYERWLEADYEVRVANDGEAGLSLLDDAVDVALLDRQLPVMSGEDVLSAIRSRGVDCRVAMVTAVEPDFDILEMGFDDYLTKPADRDDLLGTVERLAARESFEAMEREFYALASKRAALQESKTREELRDSDEFDELDVRLSELRDRIDASMAEMTNHEFVSIVRGLEADRNGGESQ